MSYQVPMRLIGLVRRTLALPELHHEHRRSPGWVTRVAVVNRPSRAHECVLEVLVARPLPVEQRLVEFVREGRAAAVRDRPPETEHRRYQVLYCVRHEVRVRAAAAAKEQELRAEELVGE